MTSTKETAGRTTGLRHRPDIDGLRAVAIIPVVLFHSDLGVFSGGFVGVDVFFVISGYLISALILKDLDRGTFSFVDFWIRRARRILPALVVVVLATIAAGWFIFFPTDYKDLGRSVLTQSFFASNIFFWFKSGYFAAAAETKPLLHTWSLSVEEQFYLCIPLILFLLTRYLPRFRTRFMLVLLALSFSACVWSSRSYPDAAFYLAHNRAWELLIGSMLAMTVESRRYRAPSTTVISEAAGAIGLAAIVLAAVFYDRDTVFPGFAALAPCLGAAAIIWSNSNGLNHTGRLLAHRSLVGIGLISYSLYLWHWPLFAFAKYSFPDELPRTVAIAIALGSVVLAWASYVFIETPFRRGPTFARRAIVIPATASALGFMLAVGTYINVTRGLESRTAFQVTTFERDASPAVRGQFCSQVTSVPLGEQFGFVCRLGSVSSPGGKILLLGDSFAGMYLKSFEQLSRSNQQEVWYARGQDMPIYPDVLELIRQQKIAHVVLSYSWNRANKNGIPELYPEAGALGGWIERTAPWLHDYLLGLGDTKSQFRANLKALIEELKERGIGISVIDAPPYYSVSIPLKLGVIAKGGGDPEKFGSNLSKHLTEQAYIQRVFAELAATGVRIIRVTDVMCDERGFCRTYLHGHSLYADEAHLSDFGAEQAIPLLEPIFAQAKTAASR